MSKDIFLSKKIYKLERSNKHLINGCNIYGSFNNNNEQIILNNDAFTFEKNKIIKNIHHLENSSNIKFLKSGIFVINLIINLKDIIKIGLFINGNLLENSEVSNDQNNLNIVIHEILQINESDILSIKNIDSINPQICKSINLVIWKIGEINDDSSENESNSESFNDSESESECESESESESDNEDNNEEDNDANVVENVIEEKSNKDTESSIEQIN